jgi:hypothetical protein
VAITLTPSLMMRSTLAIRWSTAMVFLDRMSFPSGVVNDGIMAITP